MHEPGHLSLKLTLIVLSHSLCAAEVPYTATKETGNAGKVFRNMASQRNREKVSRRCSLTESAKRKVKLHVLGIESHMVPGPCSNHVAIRP